MTEIIFQVLAAGFDPVAAAFLAFGMYVFWRFLQWWFCWGPYRNSTR